MANGLFISSFRGAGSPGAPGVGSTQRGLQQVELGRQAIAAGEAGASRTAEILKLRGEIFGAPQAPAGISQVPGATPPIRQAGLQPTVPQAPTAQVPGLQAPQQAAPQQAPARTQRQNLDRLFQLDPAAAQAALEGIGALTEFQQESAADRAFELLNTPPERRPQVIQRQVQQLRDEGRDPSDTLELLNLSTEEQDQLLNTIEAAALTVKERRGERAAASKLSPLQQKVAAEGLDPNSAEGQKRARELNQRAATDPSLKRSDQEILNKANDQQLAAAGFANRVNAANTDLTKLENTEGFDPTSITASVLENVVLGNFVLSTEHQLYAQSKSDFITAVLRKESGAVISDQEFAREDKKFFPQPGDKAAVIAQKARGRERAFDNLSKQSKGVFDVQFENPEVFDDTGDQEVPLGLTDNGDGTFTLPDGRIVRRTGG